MMITIMVRGFRNKGYGLWDKGEVEVERVISLCYHCCYSVDKYLYDDDNDNDNDGKGVKE
jgi:hypothetical protein